MIRRSLALTSASEEESASFVEQNLEEIEAVTITSNENSNDAEHDENWFSININGESLSLFELLERHPENFLKIFWQLCAFIFLVALKLIYNAFQCLLIIVIFHIGFVFSNAIIIKLGQNQRSKRLVAAHTFILVAIPASIYLFYPEPKFIKNLYYIAILFPSDLKNLRLIELLWVVVFTDLVIRLATIFLKGLLFLLPSSIMRDEDREKILVVIEFSSQLYRSLAPVQLWLSFFFNHYTGIGIEKKVVGVFLSVLYMYYKGLVIFNKIKKLCKIVCDFSQNSRYVKVISSDQLNETQCPICLDEFVVPTRLLKCKHVFCNECLAQWFNIKNCCPMCMIKVCCGRPPHEDGSTSYRMRLL